ncbi:AAA family ATPase [Shewanella gelidimarina]|uniref:AAA family ATPase n=1 Tax=Shewanella gelidimarina TaxID=56813 RepID=UPI00200C5611|nr:AAA family ATPase [Shewanella gelidimarina]MCL1056477.1 AAA family ATPase [Shewanella gelidimarina]
MEGQKLEVVFGNYGTFPSPGQITIDIDSYEKSDASLYRFMFCYPDSEKFIEGYLMIGLLPALDVPLESKKLHIENDRMLFEGLYKKDKEKRTRFFTLLPNMQEYRNIVRESGPELAGLFLMSINDLVYYKQSQTDWFDEALSSRVFKQKFMRKSESFFAFHNADTLLSGLEDEDVSVISKNLLLNFKLDGFNNEHEINLRYESDSLIPKRINVLIGKNGVGKSQALRKFSRLALKMTDETGVLRDIDQNFDRPMINRMIAISTPGETRNTFPGERIKQQKLFYRRLNFTRSTKSKLSRGIAETLIQLGRNRDSVKEKSRWDFFWSAISMSLPVEKIAFKTKSNTVEMISKFGTLDDSLSTVEFIDQFDRNEEPKFYAEEKLHPLSSGQLTFFKFALQCSLYIENGSFVLMDEPETHLHPNMITDFVGMLDSLLEATGSQALIATHSAYFVREVPREQVHIFNRSDDGNIEIISPRLRTFGADVDSISQFVFEEDINSKLTKKIYKNIKHLSFESVNEKLNKELSLSALMDLQTMMDG